MELRFNTLVQSSWDFFIWRISFKSISLKKCYSSLKSLNVLILLNNIPKYLLLWMVLWHLIWNYFCRSMLASFKMLNHNYDSQELFWFTISSKPHYTYKSQRQSKFLISNFIIMHKNPGGKITCYIIFPSCLMCF